jgi:hypothetical protein
MGLILALFFDASLIIYVAGNHEFYGSQRCHVLEDIRNACGENDVHVLDDEVLQL